MSNVYGKAKLVHYLAGHSGLTHVDVERVLDGLVRAVHARTAEGLTVALPGLGRFVQKTRAARTARNPQTGELVEVPAREALTFKASKKS